MAAAKAATKPAASKASKAAGPPKPARKKGTIPLLVAGVMLALALLPSTLVLIPAMLPTLVARVVDPVPGRHLTITVGALNFAGSLWFMYDLWSVGQTFSAIVPTLSDMIGWLAALVGAGMGWVIYSLTPSLARGIANAKSNARLKGLRKGQEELVEQWGDPVRGGNTLPGPPRM
jgi:hypothetical protein